MSGAILSVHSEYHLLLMCGRLGGCRKRRFAVFSKNFFAQRSPQDGRRFAEKHGFIRLYRSFLLQKALICPLVD